MKKNFKYPLHENAFSSSDIIEGIKVLLSKQITMSKKTLEFEKYFTKKLNINITNKRVNIFSIKFKSRDN